MSDVRKMVRSRSSIWYTPHSTLHTRFIELTPDQEKVCPTSHLPSPPALLPTKPAGKLGLLILEKWSKSGPTTFSRFRTSLTTPGPDS